jgi:hypothetical protein
MQVANEIARQYPNQYSVLYNTSSDEYGQIIGELAGSYNTIGEALQEKSRYGEDSRIVLGDNLQEHHNVNRRRSNTLDLSKPSTRIFLSVFGLVFVVAGILTLFSVNSSYRTLEDNGGVTALAEVVDVTTTREKYRSDGKTKYRTVYHIDIVYDHPEYGLVRIDDSPVDSGHHIGESTEILYSESDPDYVAHKQGYAGPILFTIMFSGLGSVVMCLGIFGGRKRDQKKRW